MLKNKITLALWWFAGIIGLATFVLFFNQASPSASIDIRLNKEEALKKSADFLRQQKFELTGYDTTVIFHSDFFASAYLQKTQGIEKSNKLIQEGIPIWFWRVRWFKELEKEGFSVDIDPASGEISRFWYSLLDDERGADLNETQARAIAEKKIIQQGINLEEYALKESTTIRQKLRTDYYFEWEKKGFIIEDATLRLGVDIYGDTLGRFRHYLKVPEEFIRHLRRETSFGDALTMASNLMVFLLLIAAIFLLLAQPGRFKVSWKFGITFAAMVVFMEILSFLNSIPLLWNFYPDTMSKAVFIMISLQRALIRAFSAGLIVFACGTVGEMLTRQLGQTKTALLQTGIVGYSLGFIFLGYVTLFYLIGIKFFNIWMPPDTAYSNMLGTALPFLFPLTLAAIAAITEEITFRLFAISFIKQCTRRTWLGVLISALVWGFAHSGYAIFPNYVRGIELTIFGIVLGIVFLKYGLTTAIIAHFTINVILAGLPLLRAHNPYFVYSGVILVCLLFIPLLLHLIKFNATEKALQ